MVLMKIVEKTKGRQDIYPKGESYLLTMEEQAVINEKEKTFDILAKGFFSLLLVFE